jgi:hypothetical protein
LPLGCGHAKFEALLSEALCRYQTSMSVVPRRLSKNATPRQRRTFRLRLCVLVILGAGAIPASAAVLVKNFMSATVQREAPCLASVQGTDPIAFASGTPSFVVLNSGTSIEGLTPLLMGTISLIGVKAERTISADSLRIRNRCSRSLRVKLVAEAQSAGAAVGGDWTDVAMRVFAGKSATVAPATDLLPPNAPAGGVASGDSFGDASVAAAWDQTPLRILASASGPGTLSNSTTGWVTLPTGSDLQIGYVVDGGSTATATDAILRFTIKSEEL